MYGYRDIPEQAAVTGGRIQAKRTHPIIARGKPFDNQVAVQVGVTLRGQIFGLGEFGRELRHFLIVLLQRFVPFVLGFTAPSSVSMPEIVEGCDSTNFFVADM